MGYIKKHLNLYRYLLAFIACIFALVLAEVACRLIIPPEPCLRFKQDTDELEGMKLDAATRMIQDDSELFWRLKPNTRFPDELWPFFGIISNGQSMREDHEIALQKPKDQTRILFLGDSCTFGYGVRQYKTFVEITESLMREKYGRPAECINAGVPGYTLFQGYQYLRTEGIRYQPDLVVLNFGWNDYRRWDDLGDLEHYALSQAVQPPRPLQQSHLCRLIWSCKRKRATTQPPEEKRPRLLPEEFATTLEKIHALTHEQGVPMLILVWPMRDNTGDAPSGIRSELQLEMMGFGQAHPISSSPHVSGVLDLIPFGRELVLKHGAPAVYFDQGHVTEMGHQAIAQAIVERISPWIERQTD